MLLLLLTASHAEGPAFPEWLARGDAAAAELDRAATALGVLADEIGASGRAHRFAELHAASELVVRRASALRSTLAAQP